MKHSTRQLNIAILLPLFLKVHSTEHVQSSAFARKFATVSQFFLIIAINLATMFVAAIICDGKVTKGKMILTGNTL